MSDRDQIPATRIHLRTEGLPPEVAEVAAFVISHALKFCARPAVFPQFQRAATEYADDEVGLDRVRSMHPALLTEINLCVCAAMWADLTEDGQ